MQPVFVPTGQVLADRTVVFAYEDDFHFGVLTCSFHYRWAVRYGGSLRVDPVYAHSEVFDTFPHPPHSTRVASVGERLNACRSSLMVEHSLGLTDFYNLVHDPSERLDPDIRQIRDMHVELDVAVRDAYGWTDLDLGHGFHQVRGQGIRFTFSPLAGDEILARLLELNKERYKAEVAAGLHEPSNRPKAAKKRMTNQDSLL